MSNDELDELSLMCTESMSLKRANEDPFILTDPRVIQNLLDAEDRYLPNATYFSFQSEVKPYMRREVTAWMSAVCKEQCCEVEVFSLAVNYMDRYLSAVDVKKRQLQLLGAVSMFIASKLKEANPFTSQELVYYTNHSITQTDIFDWEMIVLQVLRWDISAITPHEFMAQILSRLTIESEQSRAVAKKAMLLSEICATEFTFVAVPPSMMAAASISAAICAMEVKKSQSRQTRLLNRLQEITRIDIDCLRTCQHQIEVLVSPKSPPGTPSHAHDRGAEHSKCDTNVHNIIQPTTPTDVTDIVVNQ